MKNLFSQRKSLLRSSKTTIWKFLSRVFDNFKFFIIFKILKLSKIYFNKLNIFLIFSKFLNKFNNILLKIVYLKYMSDTDLREKATEIKE
jgi:hypothetical protein